MFRIVWLILSLSALLFPSGLRGIALPAPTRCPSGLAWDGENLWLADWREAKIYEINSQSGQVRGIFPAPCLKPTGLAWVKGDLFVADGEGMIYGFNPQSGEVKVRFPAPGSSPTGLGWDGRALILTDRKMVYMLNPLDGTTLDYFPAPYLHSQGVCFDGQYIWLADRMKDEIYLLRPQDGITITSVASPGPYPCGLAWDGKSIWNVDFQTDSLYRIDLAELPPFQVADYRMAELEFVHRLENLGPGTIKSGRIAIAVPTNSPRQQLLSPIKYRPQPAQVVTDRWGQEIALYPIRDLAPHQRIEVSYTLKARLGAISYVLLPERAGTLEEIPQQVRDRYLVEGSRYFITEDLVKSRAKEITAGEGNTYWIARKIFKWVINHLEYERVGGWDVAPTLIKRGTGSCSEYAFLFIALCRASGLPARFEGGTAMRGDEASVDGVYHRWAEVYLPGYGWVPIDPSRGDRKYGAERIGAIGRLSNRLFVTTYGGGDSPYLGWGTTTHPPATSARGGVS